MYWIDKIFIWTSLLILEMPDCRLPDAERVGFPAPKMTPAPCLRAIEAAFRFPTSP